MTFRVELTAESYSDLDRLMTWLKERTSTQAADRLSARFYRALDRLESRPLSCGLAYENRYLKREVRHLLFEVWKGKPYRALFVVQGDVVKVLCIRAPGEKPVNPRTSDRKMPKAMFARFGTHCKVGCNSRAARRLGTLMPEEKLRRLHCVSHGSFASVPSRSKIPASSAEIAALPWRKSRPV
jgi:hypothetical protein